MGYYYDITENKKDKRILQTMSTNKWNGKFLETSKITKNWLKKK